MYSKGWPRTPRALRSRLNEITPNLKEIGIVVDFKHDEHSKTDNITLVNNDYGLEPDQAIIHIIHIVKQTTIDDCLTILQEKQSLTFEDF